MIIYQLKQEHVDIAQSGIAYSVSKGTLFESGNRKSKYYV